MIKNLLWDFLGGPVVKILSALPLQGAQILSLLGKLKIPHAAQCGQKKIKNKYNSLKKKRGGGRGIFLQCRRPRFDPLVRKILWKRECQPTPLFLPGESHGQRSLVGNSSHKQTFRHDLATITHECNDYLNHLILLFLL